VNLNPGDKIGEYQLVKKIAQNLIGGEYWHGQGPDGQPAFIKLLALRSDQGINPEFQKKQETIRRLNQSHLLRILKIWIQNPYCVFVTELVERSLQDRHRECKELEGSAGIPRSELISHISQAADGLDFLHHYKILHGDVKPGQLLLDGNLVKICEVGFVRPGYSDSPLGAVMGTPAYMAPEVFGGSDCAASDQYALAVTYTYLRTSRLPFPGRSPKELVSAHLHKEPLLGDLPKSEQKILEKALSKDPENRYLSCREFARALQGIMA
jgi:serine/threonine protein kinase